MRSETRWRPTIKTTISRSTSGLASNGDLLEVVMTVPEDADELATLAMARRAEARYDVDQTPRHRAEPPARIRRRKRRIGPA